MTLWKNDHLSPWQEAFKRTNSSSLLLQRKFTVTRATRIKIFRAIEARVQILSCCVIFSRYLDPSVHSFLILCKRDNKTCFRGVLGGGDEMLESKHWYCAWGLQLSSSYSMLLLSSSSRAPSPECKHFESQNPRSRRACRSSSSIIPQRCSSEHWTHQTL